MDHSRSGHEEGGLDGYVDYRRGRRERVTVDAVTSPHFRDIATLMFPDKEEYQPLTPLDGPVVIAATDTVVMLPTGAPMTLCGISYTLTPRGKGSTGSMNIPGKPQERYFGAGYVDYPPVGQARM